MISLLSFLLKIFCYIFSVRYPFSVILFLLAFLCYHCYVFIFSSLMWSFLDNIIFLWSLFCNYFCYTSIQKEPFLVLATLTGVVQVLKWLPGIRDTGELQIPGVLDAGELRIPGVATPGSGESPVSRTLGIRYLKLLFKLQANLPFKAIFLDASTVCQDPQTGVYMSVFHF